MDVSAGDALVGTLIADRYRVLQKLGEGGMGVVYKAVHEALRKPVALKLLTSGGRLDREAVARFEREAVAAANLRHPNIAEATDFGKTPDGALYLVMEFVEGTTLRHVLHEKGALPPERALAILLQVGSALATAHARDVVHRDLKPENVIVTSAPGGLASTAPGSFGAAGGDFVKVIDFGIAKIRNATFGIGGGATAALTRAGMVFGTPEYMAPEQVMGQPVDARADQYALGVLAFELFTGKPPFSADDTGQLMMMHVGAPVPSTRDRTPALPPATDAVVMKMLAKLPDERFASVSEAMAALAASLGVTPAGPASLGALVSGTPSGGALSNPGAGAATRQERPPAAPAGAAPPSATSGGPTVRLGITGGQATSSGQAISGQAISGQHTTGQGTIVQAVTPATLRSLAIESPAPPDSPGGSSQSSMPLPPVPPAGATRALNAVSAQPPSLTASGNHPLVTTGNHPLVATGNHPRAAAPPQKLPPWLFAAAGGLLVCVLVLVLIARAFSGPTDLPPEVKTALADWKGGKIEPASAALKKALNDEPALANDVVLARSLAESMGTGAARRALADLLQNTPLGRSTPMAAALAEQAMKDEPSVRDPALDMLRDRQDLLNKEQGARVRLRDAEDCDELATAKTELAEVKSQFTQRDLERLPRDDCKKMLRNKEVCERCRGGGPGGGKGTGLGNMGGKGKGKGKDKKKWDD